MIPAPAPPNSWLLAICAMLWLVFPVAAVETANQWSVLESDCQYVIDAHLREESGETNKPAEWWQVRAGTGTYLHVARPIAPGLIIDDLELNVWFRSDRRGMRLLARIIFPEVVDPETGRPATLLVSGDAYERVGRWQRLAVDDVPEKMQAPLRVLRNRLRVPISTKHAYCDAAVFNIYGGPGQTESWIGQVEQFGFVPPSASDLVGAGRFGSSPHAATVPKRQSNRLIVGHGPFFPRLIESRGEPFKLFKQLGFNVVVLPQRPTSSELSAAEDLGLWIVSPPPYEFDRSYDRVLGWFLGDDFVLADRGDFLRRLHQNDPDKRPLIAGVQRDQWQSSRQVDVLLRAPKILGTSFQLADYSDWLLQMTRLVRPGTPFWSGVDTQLPVELVRQASALARDTAPVGTYLQVEQMRQMVLAGMAAGARGIWFRSETRLDDPSPESEIRRMMLELINHELQLTKPWVMGGERLGVVPNENPQIRFIACATERSRLLIPNLVQPDAQLACSPAIGDDALTVAGVPDSTDAFVLNHVGLTPISRRRVSGGLRVELGEEHSGSLILLTEDPLVITHLNRAVSLTRGRIVELEQEIAARLIEDFEVHSSRSLLDHPSRINAWESARQSLAKSRELSQSADLSASFHFGRKARRDVHRLQVELWRDTVIPYGDPLQLPFRASHSLLPMAPTGIDNVETWVAWSANQLPTGDCEDLDAMVGAGWRQYQSAPPDIETKLSLSSENPHEGDWCLRLVASPLTEVAGSCVVEYAPVWVNTAPITLRSGQRYRVTGWIRIDHPIQGGLHGCVIGDNIAGPSLALRRTRTRGWEKFEMVRAADRHDHLTITVALHGLGEVWLDELQVQLEPGSD